MICQLEKIVEHINQEKTLFRLIIERLQNRYYQNRLRDRFLFYVLLSALLNFYILWDAKYDTGWLPFALSITLGIVGGMIGGFLEWKRTMRKISGNIYEV